MVIDDFHTGPHRASVVTGDHRDPPAPHDPGARRARYK
jgi:hypothetical protein